MTNDQTILPPDHRDQGVARIGAALRDRCGVERGTRMVIAVSGGADSCALMLASASLAARPHLGYRLVVGHVDHQLRGAASNADADAVRGWAEQLGLSAEVVQVELGATDDRNVEAAARNLRYEALAGIARRHGATAVLTGHTEDDQFETVLMALLRGAGPRGMGGMPWTRPMGEDVSLLRPMLAVSHAWAESICSAAGLQWRQDETNTDTDRLRASLRRAVIPRLRDLRPGVGRRAVQTADLLRDAAGLVEEQADRAMAGTDLWDRAELQRSPDVVLGAGLRAAIERVGRGQAMDGVTHEKIRACIRAIRDDRTEPRRFQFGAHIVVHVAAGTVAVTLEPSAAGHDRGSGPMPKKVALVGHCGPDAFMLKTAVGRVVPEAEVVMVNDHAELERSLGELSLLLVNRELDGSFRDRMGVELIRGVASAGDAPPSMLISNFPDAQQAAEDAGALPGFGKSGLYDAETADRIRAAFEIDE